MDLEQDPSQEKRNQRWKERMDPGSHTESEPKNKNMPKEPDPDYTNAPHRLRRDVEEEKE